MIEELKKIAKTYIEKSQYNLSEDDAIQSTLITISGNKRTTVNVDIEDEKDTDFLSQIMDTATQQPETDAIILIIDSYVATVEHEDIDNLPELIKDYDESSDAIVTFIYTKDACYMDQIIYKRKDKKNYLFFDIGWKSGPMGGRLGNPFLNSNV